MYIPKHFEEARQDELLRIVGRYPLGTLVTHGAQGLDADHLPFEFKAGAGTRGSLLAHVARANPLWQVPGDGAEVMVIFRAADAYISPNWYPGKHETHRQVPTWNYQAVHVHGVLRVHDDLRFVRGLVARLTHAHEARAQEPRPWKMTDSSREYIDQMLAAIVGIEVEIRHIVGKSKLGQNREARDRTGAAEALRQRGKDEVAEAMLRAVPRQP